MKRERSWDFGNRVGRLVRLGILKEPGPNVAAQGLSRRSFQVLCHGHGTRLHPSDYVGTVLAHL